MNRKNPKLKIWKSKTERPEESYINPEFYYTKEEVLRYANSKNIKKVQEIFAEKILELLDFDSENKKNKKILDLGCGVGYTTEFYKKKGINVIGLDKLKEMLEIAKNKKLNVTQGDIRQLKEIFKENEFDAVVSASAIQWLKERSDLKEMIEGIFYVLKNKGKVCIQFYPRSESEIFQLEKLFKKKGFKGNSIILNQNQPKNRVVYLLFEVEK
jgi:ubiquinone/menaquinone biosynthesis C-methylase UbiE